MHSHLKSKSSSSDSDMSIDGEDLQTNSTIIKRMDTSNGNNNNQKVNNSYKEKAKGIISKMWEKCRDSPKALPLGMDSGIPSSSNNLFASSSSSTATETSSPSVTDNTKTQQSTYNQYIQQHQQVRSISRATSEGGEEPIVSWHPYEPTANELSASDNLSHKSYHCCHNSYPYASSSESDLSSDSITIDPSIMLDSNVTMALAQKGTNMMQIQAASELHTNLDDNYKMSSKPRGICLIVNNIDFEGEIFPTRKGSDEDAKRFDDIFQKLYFTVELRRNQTADKMKELFKEVAKGCKPEHDALFVFILSHGSEHGIYGTDGIEVCLEDDIISCFDNRNCKAMLGKPKVFVIQACRGRAKDCGGDVEVTDSIAWPTSSSPVSHTNRVPASWLPSSQPTEGKLRKRPIRTDMLLVFSCLAGFVSVRNELAGSWLGVALAYFLMTHAHERDLLRILNLVTSDVIQRESSNGHIQSIELKLLGWTKNLYFNPGYYQVRK